MLSACGRMMAARDGPQRTVEYVYLVYIAMKMLVNCLASVVIKGIRIYNHIVHVILFILFES